MTRHYQWTVVNGQIVTARVRDDNHLTDVHPPRRVELPRRDDPKPYVTLRPALGITLAPLALAVTVRAEDGPVRSDGTLIRAVFYDTSFCGKSFPFKGPSELVVVDAARYQRAQAQPNQKSSIEIEREEYNKAYCKIRLWEGQKRGDILLDLFGEQDWRGLSMARTHARACARLVEAEKRIPHEWLYEHIADEKIRTHRYWLVSTLMKNLSPDQADLMVREAIKRIDHKSAISLAKWRAQRNYKELDAARAAAREARRVQRQLHNGRKQPVDAA